MPEADIDFDEEAAKYRAAGHGPKEAEACLKDFKKKGHGAKETYYTRLLAALRKGGKK